MTWSQRTLIGQGKSGAEVQVLSAFTDSADDVHICRMTETM